MNQKEMYDRILYWFSNSNIRNKDGAVYSWLNPQHEGYVYPEIIGYSMKFFSYLYSIEKNNKFKELATSSADYISTILSKKGAVSREGIEYVFDTGICLSGMLSLNKVNLLKENHKKSIDAMAQFIRHSLSKKVSAFKDGKPFIDNSSWSLSYGALLIKTAISLIEYGKYSNNREYIDFAERLVEEMISKTFKGNRFTINEFQDWTYTHPHCYATEGLCFLRVNGYEQYSNIIQRSAQWLSNVQNDDGSINSWHFREDIKKDKQGDATAQSVRIWLFVDKVKYKDNINKAISFLKTLQSPEGGLYYNNNSKDVNSWVSMFALQALYWDINNRVDFDWII
jgi:hypothetical protein